MQQFSHSMVASITSAPPMSPVKGPGIEEGSADFDAFGRSTEAEKDFE